VNAKRTLAVVAKKYRWTRKTVVICIYMCRFRACEKCLKSLVGSLQKYQYISNKEKVTPTVKVSFSSFVPSISLANWLFLHDSETLRDIYLSTWLFSISTCLRITSFPLK